MFREGICFDRPPPQRERREEAVRRHAEREGPAEHHLFTARDCEERTGHRSWGSMRTAEHHLFTARSCEDKSSSSHPQRSDRSSPRASEAAAAEVQKLTGELAAKAKMAEELQVKIKELEAASQ